MPEKKIPGTGGQKYIPYEERTGPESVVYFTRDLSPEGLKKVYERVNGAITGKVAIKLHTGEPNGPNIIPAAWVKEFMQAELPEAAIIETNTYYEGGKWFGEMSVGKFLMEYDSLVALTHFNGHTLGGFGGSNKNIRIGCADGRIGKGMIHAMTEEDHHDLMERIESRHGYRQLSYMKELGMGNDRYTLIDIDNGDKRITAA